jgi:hypothetical protein
MLISVNFHFSDLIQRFGFYERCARKIRGPPRARETIVSCAIGRVANQLGQFARTGQEYVTKQKTE